jgi:hypothetical protein
VPERLQDGPRRASETGGKNGIIADKSDSFQAQISCPLHGSFVILLKKDGADAYGIAYGRNNAFSGTVAAR